MHDEKEELTQRPVLLLVDIQKGLDEHTYYGGARNNPDAEQNAAKILTFWRQQQWPLYHIQHSSTNPQSPLHRSKSGFAIKDEVRPLAGENHIVKEVNAAFIGTHLDRDLKAMMIKEVVIVGLTTNHCISSTARMASNLGYRTRIVEDATAAFDRRGLEGEFFAADLIHRTTLASLKDEFAAILSTEELLHAMGGR